jgi:hypothetical protein
VSWDVNLRLNEILAECDKPSPVAVLVSTFVIPVVGVQDGVGGVVRRRSVRSSGRMGPRLLRNFKQDWRNQGTLGAFRRHFHTLMVHPVFARGTALSRQHLSRCRSSILMMAFGGVRYAGLYFIGHMACLLFARRFRRLADRGAGHFAVGESAKGEMGAGDCGGGRCSTTVSAVVIFSLLGVLASGTVPTAGENLQWLLRKPAALCLATQLLGCGTFGVWQSC